MALVKCPQCNNEISDTVEKCPHCGNTISHNVLPVSTPAPSVQNNIPKFLTIAALILAIIGTCFLIKVQIPAHLTTHSAKS